MPRRALLAPSLTLCLALGLGCNRSKGPDASYEKAARIYQQLYASSLDDAYADPKMNDVVELLKQVDERSIDAEPAKAMLGAISHGREALAQQRAERERRGAAAAASAAQRVQLDPEKILAASASAAAAALPDAGPPADPFGPGSSVAEINTATGGCLVDGEQFTENGTNQAGTIYRLAPAPRCADRLPGYGGQAILVVGGRVYRRIADPQAGKPVQPAAAPVAPAPRSPPPRAGNSAPDAGA